MHTRQIQVRTFLLSLLISTATTSAICAQGPGNTSIDQTLVSINDQILTESMVVKIADRLLAVNPELEVPAAGQYALNTGIRRILYHESFVRLGLDENLLDPQVAARIQALISEDGSRQRFLNRIAADGYTSIEEFRIALRHQFVESTVAGIVSGSIPSPNEGKRQISEPTPSELREAFAQNVKYRERPAEFEWATLKFLNDPSLAPPAERAAETLNRLGANLMTINTALAKADKVTTFDEIRPGAKKELADFLSTATPGECMELPSTVSGVYQLVLVTKRSEARTFTFAEAQLLITQDLMRLAQENAVQGELSAVWQDAYVWISDDLPGLQDSLDFTFGGGNSGSEEF